MVLTFERSRWYPLKWSDQICRPGRPHETSYALAWEREVAFGEHVLLAKFTGGNSFLPMRCCDL
jgi:hypothetical protein